MQVQRELDAAQTLHSDLYGAKETPPADPPAAEVVEPAPAVTPEPTPAPVSDPFEQKYKVLQGKFDAEVPRLHAQLKDRDTMLQQMSDRLAALEKKPEPETTAEALVTEKDAEDFGADLVDMARRAAREEFKSESKALLTAIDKRFEALQVNLGAIQKQVVESESDKFWGRVQAMVPDWASVDADPSWVEFLDMRIPGTRKTRRQEAAEAIAAGDPEPIKELVDLWRPPVAANKQAEQKQQNQKDLQRQVAPSTAKSSAPAPNAANRLWLGPEYEAAFSQKTAQTLAPDALATLQAEANAALNEGRVRW
jgi:hypothetical protein